MINNLRLVAAAAFLLGAGSLFAQATATISGRVVDQAGAVLPGATVVITNAGTGATRETVSNAEGLYIVPALDPGMYSVKAQLTGFTAQSRDNIELITGSNLSVELELGIAALQENLTVTGQAPLVETTQATLASSIRQQEVVQIPMINRSMSAMMSLLPGAREVGGAVSAHGTSQTYVSFSGGGGQNYNMLVDGIDNKEDHCGGASIVYSLEGIQEFRVVATGASAEYGRGTTSVMMATKSGTNQYHGGISVYGRNQNLTAIDYFSKPENGGTGKPPYNRYQFGGSFGGPIVKDRAWFFGSVERATQDYTVVRPERVVREHQLLVPLNIGIKVTDTIPQPSKDLMTQGKVNLQLGRPHAAYVRWATQHGYVDNDFIGNTAAMLDYAPFMDHNAQNLWNLAGGWTWIVNSSTVNQVTAQFITWTHDQDYPSCPIPQPGGCLYQRLTFPTVSAGPIHAFPKWYNFEDKYQIKDDFSKQIGRHSLKTGGDLSLLPVYGGIFGGGSPGAINFFHDPSTIVNNTNGRYPQGFQTPGAVRSITVFSDPIGDYSSDGNWNFGAYVQDDYRVTANLTLNLGLRYDIYEYMNQPNLEKNRTYQALKAIGSPYGALPQTDKNNFSPRLGMAWDLKGDGTSVVRGSYGLYYVMQIKNTYYQRNYIERDIIFINQAFVNSDIGVGQLPNFIYGVTPISSVAPTPVNPTNFPTGGNNTGYWYDPNIKDAQTHKWHAGYSRVLANDTVISADYTHVVLQNGWRNLNINPMLDHDNNPSTARVRPLAAEFQRVYNDPRLMGIVNIAASANRGLYDELAVHFERRFSSDASMQVNYTLANARGMGGATDGALRVASPAPQTPSVAGGDIYAPWEYGPTAFDERHRVTIAGILNLPFGFDVSPSMTAASARPYDQYSGANPSGDGSLQILGEDGSPVGIRAARGKALFNMNARITKNFEMGAPGQRLGLFIEMYNLTNRANFGNVYGTTRGNVTFNQPLGYLGGIGAVSTIPNSFQMQFGARYSF
jgi:hypothetical protein